MRWRGGCSPRRRSCTSTCGSSSSARPGTPATTPSGPWNSAEVLLRTPSLRFLRFLRFLLVGALNTLFGYGIFALLVTLHVHYALAAALSTVAGIVFNFFSTGTLVFGRREAGLFPRFLAVYGVCYVIGVAALAAADRAHVDVRLAGAALAVPQALLAYVLQKTFVFRDPSVSDPGDGGR